MVEHSKMLIGLKQHLGVLRYPRGRGHFQCPRRHLHRSHLTSDSRLIRDNFSVFAKSDYMMALVRHEGFNCGPELF